MPTPTTLSFVGLGKETTRGTAVTADKFIPVKSLDSPNDNYNYVADTGMRGSFVTDYDEIGTQAWSEPGFSGDVFPDSIGYLLYALMGEVATSGPASTVYTHNFTLLNTTPGQPPSYTYVDYNGFNARAMAGTLVQELDFKFSATGLLEYQCKLKGLKSAVVTKPTQVFTTETPKPAWQGATTLGGSSSSILQDGNISISRPVDPIISVNGSQDPYRIWAGPLSVNGHLNLIYEDDTEMARYTGSTNTTLDIDFTSGSTTTLREVKFHASKVLYTAAKPDRGQSYVRLGVDFRCVANTTDVGASGGYGPVKVTLKNLLTAY